MIILKSWKNVATSSFHFHNLIAIILIIYISTGAYGESLTRRRRGFNQGYGGVIGNYRGSSYSPDASIGSGVAGALATHSTQQNLLGIYADDLGSAFQVGYAAQAIANARRTSAASGSKFKGGHGK